jgi:general secretion pathway protein G
MTLIEIMIVLAIVGSLMAILLPRFTGQRDKAKVSETKILMGQLINALHMYQNDCGSFPTSLDSLKTADANCSNWGPEPYVKNEPKDSWENAFAYSLEGGNFVIRSLGSDKREGGEGYAKDISSEDLDR